MATLGIPPEYADPSAVKVFEWENASTEEKIVHKNWKARIEGYEECCKLFREVDDPENPIYLNYVSLVNKFVADTNEVARDKALDAILAIVEKIPAASKTAGEVLPELIKCLNGKLNEKASGIIITYMKVGKIEIVQDALIKGLENKNPKTLQTCLDILKRSISEFDSKKIPVKPIINQFSKLFDDRDKMVRDKAKQLAVEMYRWVGNILISQLKELNKPTLLQELVEEFATVTPNVATELQAVEIMSMLPKDFKLKLEAEKWEERKEVLDALLVILQNNPRLQVIDYSDLVKDLIKMVEKDTSVNIVIVAAKCLASLASGLSKDFAKYVKMCMKPLMERFKEKKQNVVDALHEACNAIYLSTNLEGIQEICVGMLVHKTPVVRQQVTLFLARCFSMATQTTLPTKILQIYLTHLIKNLSEADPGVRESSTEALGSICKALGEKIFISQVSTQLESAKLKKIKEFAEKVVLLDETGKPREMPLNQPQQPSVTSNPPTQSQQLPPPSLSPPQPGGQESKKIILEESDMMMEKTVEKKAIELFGVECVASLSATNLDERKKGLETIETALKCMKSDEMSVEVILRTLVENPGFKEAKNVMSMLVEKLTLPYVCQQGLGSILTESKSQKKQEQALLWLGQAIKEFGFQGMDIKVLLGYIKKSMHNSNPAVRIAAVQLIAVVYMYLGARFRGPFDQEKTAILEQIDVEVDKLKEVFGVTNDDNRLDIKIEQEPSKPLIKPKSEKDYKQNNHGVEREAAAPSTTKKDLEEGPSPKLKKSNKAKRIEEEKSLTTLKWNFHVPSNEFIEQLRAQMEVAGFNPTLQIQLFHKDFKYHILALHSLTKAIEDLPEETVSNLDLILRWLTLRFFENFQTVTVKMIEYMHALFEMLKIREYSMSDYEADGFLPYFVGKFGDPKESIRKGFREIIKKIALIYSPVKIFNFLLQALETKNSRQRADCLEEIGEMIENLGLEIFNPSVTLKEIAKYLGDRDYGVRNATLNVITLAYKIQGKQIYKLIGKLNDKDQTMLDERIKHSSNKLSIPQITKAISQPSISIKLPPPKPVTLYQKSIDNVNEVRGADSKDGGETTTTTLQIPQISKICTTITKIPRPLASYKGQSLTERIRLSPANTN